MGYKSRSNWGMPLCIKDCANKGRLCADCFRDSKFKGRGEDVESNRNSKERVGNPG